MTVYDYESQSARGIYVYNGEVGYVRTLCYVMSALMLEFSNSCKVFGNAQ